AMAARMPMVATTIISSMRVKPLASLRIGMFLLGVDRLNHVSQVTGQVKDQAPRPVTSSREPAMDGNRPSADKDWPRLRLAWSREMAANPPRVATNTHRPAVRPA